MNNDDCQHEWGAAELVETGMGELNSPICKHCGAVKLLHDEEANRRHRAEVLQRTINRPPGF